MIGIWEAYGGSFRCSNCRHMPEFKDITKIKHCPNCGSKMVGYERHEFDIHGRFVGYTTIPIPQEE